VLEVTRVFNGVMGAGAVREQTVHRLMNDFLAQLPAL
jgi:hypothetical protein